MTTEPQELTSIPSGTLVVTVLAEGAPVSGRIVSVREAVAGSAETRLTSGENGKTTFTLAGEKEYSLSTSLQTGVPSEQGSVFVPGGQATAYTFAFHRIFGHIVDIQGNPVKQRPLSVRISTPIEIWNDDLYQGARVEDVRAPVDQLSGEFWLDVSPGSYLLECLEDDQPIGQVRVMVKNAAAHVSITLF
jgi:hypothetical protein